MTEVLEDHVANSSIYLTLRRDLKKLSEMLVSN